MTCSHFSSLCYKVSQSARCSLIHYFRKIQFTPILITNLLLWTAHCYCPNETEQKKIQYSWLVVNLIINIKELEMNALTGNYKIDKENVEDLYEHFQFPLELSSSQRNCVLFSFILLL